MAIKLKLISAVCENFGIGINKTLPWKLDKEMEYFDRMTRTTKDKSKRNVMIMGRLTWESFPEVPDTQRICIILSSGVEVTQFNHVYGFKTLEEAIWALENDRKFMEEVENVWIIGGSKIYEEGLRSRNFHRLYLTKIYKSFDCDVFFPSFPHDLFKIRDSDVPEGIQEENGIFYEFNVYEKSNLL